MLPRPPHPVPNVRDDRDTPLMWDGMARLIVLIWVRSETEYICKWDWTAQITLIRFKKIRFACALLTGALMRSVDLQSTRLYGAFPAGDLFGHVACEVFGTAALGRDTDHADLEQPRLDGRCVHRCMRHLVQPGDDLLRCALRHEECCPSRDIVVGQSELVRGRKVWHQRRAHFREQSKRLHLLTVYVGGRAAEIATHVIDPTADQVVHRGCQAAIGDVHRLYSNPRVEQRASKMCGRAGPGRAVLHLGAVLFQERNEL